MGGLAPRMMTTTVTMTIGGIGLAGVPWISAGFFSKEEILAVALDGNRVMFALLLLGALLTAFYTFRLLFLAFFTGPRMTQDVARHIHESPAVMTAPLMALALLTLVTGWFLGIRSPSAGTTPFARFLAPVFPIHEAEHGGHGGMLLLIASLVVVAIGFLVALQLYVLSPRRVEDIGEPRTPIHASRDRAADLRAVGLRRPRARPRGDRRPGKSRRPRGRRLGGRDAPAADRLHRELRAHDAGRRRPDRRLSPRSMTRPRLAPRAMTDPS
ncbi:MAG: hypothetical protein DMD81_13825 [Candidatus Rokuibacteriota bacterium]|nr:MAG: hypothetical protein DMD81_13825 [Candidatus Rokubacteria bacterium]